MLFSIWRDACEASGSKTSPSSELPSKLLSSLQLSLTVKMRRGLPHVSVPFLCGERVTGWVPGGKERLTHV